VAVLFYLKKRANSKEEKVPVYVRITCDGQRTELATGQKIRAKLWIPSEERAKGGGLKSFVEFDPGIYNITDMIEKSFFLSGISRKVVI
jgi:hypothetical protein